jgi:hypothetical protein
VTSKTEIVGKSKTEYVLEQMNEEKVKKASWRAKKAEKKKARNEVLNKHLDEIENYIKQLQELEKMDESFTATYNLARAELKTANTISGMRQRKENLQTELEKLKNSF